MGNQVYANKMEISCKAADGKAICAMPDVCMTPPQTPATPPGVPIPYPNTGMASDCTDGSSTVQISGQETMLKNKSCFKQSTGDEAGCAPMKGVMTATNTGKVFFCMYSMDVSIESENVVRHLDMTTHNNVASASSNQAVPWPYIDAMAIAPGGACEKDHNKAKDACSGVKDPCAGLKKPPTGPGKTKEVVGPIAEDLADSIATNQCLSFRRCFLQTEKKGCCEAQTGHHIVEASSFVQDRGEETQCFIKTFSNSPHTYDPGEAPCVCAEGTSHSLGGTHELMHTYQSAVACKIKRESSLPLSNGKTLTKCRKTTYGDAKKSGVDAFQKTFQDSGCSRECIEAQLDNYHNKCGITDSTACQAVATRTSNLNALTEQADEIATQRFYQAVASRL